MAFLDKTTNWAGLYDINSTIILSDNTSNIITKQDIATMKIEFVGDANWKVSLYVNPPNIPQIIIFIATAIITPNCTKYLAINNVENLGNGQITAVQICQDKVVTATSLIYLLDLSDPTKTMTLVTQGLLKIKA